MDGFNSALFDKTGYCQYLDHLNSAFFTWLVNVNTQIIGTTGAFEQLQLLVLHWLLSIFGHSD